MKELAQQLALKTVRLKVDEGKLFYEIPTLHTNETLKRLLKKNKSIIRSAIGKISKNDSWVCIVRNTWEKNRIKHLNPALIILSEKETENLLRIFCPKSIESKSNLESSESE